MKAAKPLHIVLATNPNPTRARGYPLNINPKPDPKPDSISGPAGSGRVADLYWGSPGIVSWTPPLLHIHYITGSHHTGTWLLLPFLCWWHTALSLISIRWSNGSCTDVRLPGGHLGVDERTSPTAQPGKDWAYSLSCHSNSTAWFHDSVRFINNYPISFGQKSWCNLRWPADLQRAHCKDCSILQVWTRGRPICVFQGRYRYRLLQIK